VPVFAGLASATLVGSATAATSRTIAFFMLSFLLTSPDCAPHRLRRLSTTPQRLVTSV
jgi:hypothetical protein